MVFPIPTVHRLSGKYAFGKLFPLLSICRAKNLIQRKFIVDLRDRKLPSLLKNLSITKCDEF